VLAAAYLALDPPSADLAAQAFRADLFAREGPTLWNGDWYGGHHTPGYSVLFPPLAALLGPQLVGALSAVAASALFAPLAGRRPLPVALFAAGTVATLVSGRLTFALGTAAGVAAVLAAARGRPVLAGALALLTALCSPVAALFAALAGGALVLSAAPAAGAALVASAAAGVLALTLAFPEGGTFPFALSSFAPAVVAGLALAAAPAPRALRAGGALYALLCVAALVVPSPAGGNVVRLGTLLAPALAALVLLPRRPLVLAALALPLAYWQWQPAVRDWRRAAGDPSVEARFHAPLAAALRAAGPVRVEVPTLRSHGEARHLAGGRDRVPLARGWERQLDRAYHPLFYDGGPPTAATYRRWLDANAVGVVAVPDGVPLDPSGAAEAALVRGGLPYLREGPRAGAYRVFRVAGARPLARGAARLERLDPQGFVLTGRRSGTTEVRVRFTPYWVLLSGRGCVEPAPGGWTRVRTTRAGRVHVGVRFALSRIRAERPRCTD
jgi:hypothetical protein